MSEALKETINIHQEKTKKGGMMEVLKLEREVYIKLNELKKEVNYE